MYLMLIGVPLFAGPLFNVAFNKDVVLDPENGFFVGGWDDGVVSPADSVVDGVFLPEGSQWNQAGSVWWDQNGQNDVGQAIYIELGQKVEIEKLIAQVDNNDSYIVSYRNLDTGEWEAVWYINSVNGWGLLTRPNPNDLNEMYVLSTPIETDALKIEGNLDLDTDKLFAVSEIQAYGSIVPAPGSLLLAFMGITLAGYIKHRKQD